MAGPASGFRFMKHFGSSEFIRCRSGQIACLRSSCGFVAFQSRGNDIYQTRQNSTRAGPVRIGCASGFWGDTAFAAPQLLHKGKLDYLVLDYLSEITMSLLAAVKQKAPEKGGFAPDFILAVMKPNLKIIHEKGVKVIANCGGVNPHACARELASVAQAAGIPLKIAVVAGDDLLSLTKSENSSILESVREMDSDAHFPSASSVTSINAYLGAFPIAKALDLDADVVITGRCVDSALVLGPLIHSYGWSENDLDLLASGSLAGHLIECGAQATGGVLTDWESTAPTWDSIGFPIVQVDSDGKFVLTKPRGTGGAVTTMTAAEQLLYEIGDPKNYILPDVTCDFSNVSLEQTDADVVSVSGAKGKKAPSGFKVCATYLDGYKLTAVCPVAGGKARDKARATANAILRRARVGFAKMGLEDFTAMEVQIIGAGEMFGAQARQSESESREVVLWLAVRHRQKAALELLAREIAPAGTGMAPGLTGMVGGRPKASPVLRLYSFLWPKRDVNVDIYLDGDWKHHVMWANGDESQTDQEDDVHADPVSSAPAPSQDQNRRIVTLGEVACARSGDKGDNVNIGIVARSPELFPALERSLTHEKIFDYFRHYFPAEAECDRVVAKYRVPGIHALNFVLKGVLGGGGVASLRVDPQGKAMAQMLLDIELEI